MNKQLQPVEYHDQRILTTEQLAEFYKTNPQRIINNFNRNKSRYIEGIHYFFLEGEKLKTFLTSTQFELMSGEVNNIARLYLSDVD